VDNIEGALAPAGYGGNPTRNGYAFTAPRGGWEFPALLLIVYFAIFFRGAGRCSIDKMIGKEF
jgi:hypothetical protein